MHRRRSQRPPPAHLASCFCTYAPYYSLSQNKRPRDLAGRFGNVTTEEITGSCSAWTSETVQPCHAFVCASPSPSSSRAWQQAFRPTRPGLGTAPASAPAAESGPGRAPHRQRPGRQDQRSGWTRASSWSLAPPVKVEERKPMPAQMHPLCHFTHASPSALSLGSAAPLAPFSRAFWSARRRRKNAEFISEMGCPCTK